MDPINFLLVDDEKDFAEVLARRLRQRGLTANCVFSGTEALNRLKEDDTIDIVVLDVGMPDPDGIKTVERIKKEYPLVEVIMLTGHASVSSAISALKFGAFDYLTKPYDLDHLISKAKQAAFQKKEREAAILKIRMTPLYLKAGTRYNDI